MRIINCGIICAVVWGICRVAFRRRRNWLPCIRSCIIRVCPCRSIWEYNRGRITNLGIRRFIPVCRRRRCCREIDNNSIRTNELGPRAVEGCPIGKIRRVHPATCHKRNSPPQERNHRRSGTPAQRRHLGVTPAKIDILLCQSQPVLVRWTYRHNITCGDDIARRQVDTAPVDLFRFGRSRDIGLRGGKGRPAHQKHDAEEKAEKAMQEPRRH